MAWLASAQAAYAQSGTSPTIENTALAQWTMGGTPQQVSSNQVTVTLDNRPAGIQTFRSSAGGQQQLTFTDVSCQATGGASAGGAQPGPMVTASVVPVSGLRAGEDIYFLLVQPGANLDPAVIDTVMLVLESESGDRETFTVFETAANSGEFIGRVVTRPAASGAIPGDCVLGVTALEPVAISLMTQGAGPVDFSGSVDILADPFGIIFDSETGEGVSDAVVTLVDAATGQPAVVFAADGITPWPSRIISGRPITDGAGTVYPMQPGEYWFPLTALGEYRIEVEAPAAYGPAPSVVPRASLDTLLGPDGQPFILSAASFGASFALSGPDPVQVDIPLDRRTSSVGLTKAASRQSAQPGDVLFYQLTVTNQEASRARRDVTITDSPSRWLRIRPDTIRIDGAEAAPGVVDLAQDGRRLTIFLEQLPAGATRRISYAASIRADAPPGQVVNTAEATDALGQTSRASAVVEVERDTIASRMSIIGRVTLGDCRNPDRSIGVAGIRIMLQDGSFAVTDADGRYHFEGLVPGSHVVQASKATLPLGASFVDCTRSTQSAGSANSRFISGQGGALLRADFHVAAGVDEAARIAFADDLALPEWATLAGAPVMAEPAVLRPAPDPQTDWLALGNGEDGWLTPDVDHNPRVPAIRVAFRHRAGQTIRLYADGRLVDPLAFDGTFTAKDRSFAVSQWRAVPLVNAQTLLKAEIVNSMGGVNATFERTVHFVSEPANVELVEELSVLVADGVSRPVAVVRITDRNGRPVREGVAGEFVIGAPYQSAAQIDLQQLRDLSGLGDATARWVIEGSEGLARIELAPTMVSGALRIEFSFGNENIRRTREIEAWVTPGDVEWTLVGLAEAAIGSRTIADNMERPEDFDSDLGKNARVALYAKGRILGKYLLTLAYDSAKQRDNQRVLGALDPNSYYTIFADNSSRRFDAPSRENLYVRIETSTFFALYGDFQTAFDETRLARYQRTATGIRSEAQFGAVRAQAFGAEIGTRFRRDEIQGNGLSGPYRLSSRDIIANGEVVTIETRDRFRSEVIVNARTLTRFVDYTIDLLSGTITLSEPLASRDFDLNPQFIVIEYETDSAGDGEINAGVRADWTGAGDALRIGATAITDKEDGPRTNIGAIDVELDITPTTQLRTELALSESDGAVAEGWLVEAQHQSRDLDLIAYVRSADEDYGIGQQNAAEVGRRKIGVDARLALNENLHVTTSLWQDNSLTSSLRRRAGEVDLAYRTQSTDLRLGIAHFTDRLADDTRNVSTVLEGGASRRLLDNRLELSASTSIALDNTASVDLPARHRFGAKYAIANDVRLTGLYEIAEGDTLSARTLRAGIEASPWQGARILTTLGQESAGGATGHFASLGLAQTLAVTPSLTLDATIDGNRLLGAAPQLGDIVNPDQPVANGGPIGIDAAVFEEFTAITLGGSWRRDRISAIGRVEVRDGQFSDRRGLRFGVIRQLGEGSAAGGSLTWTRSLGINGSSTEIQDIAVTFAHRPGESAFSLLGKLEYRSDAVTGAVLGETASAGRTAFNITGDGQSRRLIASLSSNLSPRSLDALGNLIQRSEFSLFLGGRYGFDALDGLALEGFTGLVGLDARIGLSERFDIGGSASLRANLTDGSYSYSYGPMAGLVVTDDVLLSLGYNLAGFHDADFSELRNLDQGVFAGIRAKLDADLLGTLGIQ